MDSIMAHLLGTHMYIHVFTLQVTKKKKKKNEGEKEIDKPLSREK